MTFRYCFDAIDSTMCVKIATEYCKKYSCSELWVYRLWYLFKYAIKPNDYKQQLCKPNVRISEVHEASYTTCKSKLTCTNIW